jgi:hypothetical protein
VLLSILTAITGEAYVNIEEEQLYQVGVLGMVMRFVDRYSIGDKQEPRINPGLGNS